MSLRHPDLLCNLHHSPPDDHSSAVKAHLSSCCCCCLLSADGCRWWWDGGSAPPWRATLRHTAVNDKQHPTRKQERVRGRTSEALLDGEDVASFVLRGRLDTVSQEARLRCVPSRCTGCFKWPLMLCWTEACPWTNHSKVICAAVTQPL